MLILSRRDVVTLLTLRDCIDAVEAAFRLHAAGRTFGPGVLGVAAGDGSFHVKAAGLVGESRYFAAKTNANYPQNPARFGLPTIQGTVVLSDAGTGTPLALMDSGSITAIRTAAATAVAARVLARQDARRVTIVGCGAQGEVQLAAIAAVRPLDRAYVLDADHARAEALAARAGGAFGLPVEAARDLQAALRASDILVTCTTSRAAFVFTPDVAPGTFIAAVGADHHGKQELAPDLVASATVVADSLEQCAEIGELQHVLGPGLLRRDQVHGELADLVSGRRPGRTRADEVTIFDSTGVALEDVAAAIVVYEKARATGRGTEVDLDDWTGMDGGDLS
jgi:ornithine cyclodeaminase/alanine dehydrogenase-like protein (mu-crystallin family)